MPLRKRQEVQEMLPQLNHASHPHIHARDTCAHHAVPSELNLRKPAHEDGDNRGRLHHYKNHYSAAGANSAKLKRVKQLLEWRNWQTHGTQKPNSRIAEGNILCPV